MQSQGVQSQGAPSGLLKAGTILLLVGAILQAVGAAFLLVGGTAMLTVGRNLLGEGESSMGLDVVGGVYLGLGVLIAIGCAFGFSAWKRAQAGDLQRAFVRGLVASLLPPLQVVSLLGAIFVKVCPEADAQARAQAP